MVDGLRTVIDIEDKQLARRFAISKQLVAIKCAPPQYTPLLSGTEHFTSAQIANSHRWTHPWKPCDVACYTAENVSISGFGNIWFDENLLTDTRIMPFYVHQVLGVDTSGQKILDEFRRLPIRHIDMPCIIAAGHGTQVYGHFLIENLFRILVASYARGPQYAHSKILIDKHTPEWLLNIYRTYFNLGSDRIVFFDPYAERLHLSKAVLLGRVLRDNFFHPFARQAIEDLKSFLPKSEVKTFDNLFIARGNYINPHAPRRVMINEDAIADIACAEFGFVKIKPEEFSWIDQIALFNNARVVVGQAGSSLHGAMFSKENTLVASIGYQNSVQSEIAAAWKHRMAFLTHNIDLSSDFAVDEEAFREYIHSVMTAA